MHTGAIAIGASGLADGINFIEDDDVEIGVVTHLFLLLLGILEQGTDVGFGFAHILIQNLGTVHDLRLVRVQRLTDLTGDQGLTAAGRTVEQHTTDVLDAHLAEHLRREHTGGERTTEDVGELLIQTTNAHRLEVEAALEQTAVAAAGTALNTDGDVLLLLEEKSGRFDQLAARTTEDFLR